MSKAQQPGAPTCPIEMSDGFPCRRPIYHAPGSANPDSLCIMHCAETTKNPVEFCQEIDAILAGTSADHRPKDRFDFTGFVFPEADFRFAKFTQNANFCGAPFTQNADSFAANCPQDAYYSDANVTQDANFCDAKFTQNAEFSGATFTQNADFSGATFTQNAEFRRTEFRQPELVRFYQ